MGDSSLLDMSTASMASEQKLVELEKVGPCFPVACGAHLASSLCVDPLCVNCMCVMSPGGRFPPNPQPLCLSDEPNNAPPPTGQENLALTLRLRQLEQDHGVNTQLDVSAEASKDPHHACNEQNARLLALYQHRRAQVQQRDRVLVKAHALVASLKGEIDTTSQR